MVGLILDQYVVTHIPCQPGYTRAEPSCERYAPFYSPSCPQSYHLVRAEHDHPPARCEQEIAGEACRNGRFVVSVATPVCDDALVHRVKHVDLAIRGNG